ncbi:MAG: translation initiation factor eIF-1A [Candidatus Pacearchaeota archaeon]
MEKNKEDNKENFIPLRVKLPKGKEKIGIITQRLGAGRMYVACMDGKTRNCRVPGRFKRDFWLREGDVVLVEPWEFDDNKADIIFKYTKGEAEKLRIDGFLKNISSEEF